jgi:predicted RNase H-like nuclease (RuvC/YqgF family)
LSWGREMSSQGKDLVSMGVDLYRGSPASRLRATYAISIVKNGEVVYEATDIPLAKVIRLALEYKPGYIVLDNIYELARSKKELVKILSLFPYRSQILLATFSVSTGYRDIREVAAEHGLLESRRKPDPQTTARILAMLGQKGVGQAIRVWEERTKIVISKGRSGKAGGSSEDRYLRSLRTAVLRYVRKIKESLDREGIPYQLSYRKAEGGLDRAVFIVEAPRERLAGIVKSRRGRYVVVRVKPVARTRILISEDVEKRMRPIIVGIDPGAVYGIAVIDLDGRVVTTETIRGGDVYQAISAIIKYGTPVLVASDKKPLPEAVRKVAAAFNARVYEPEYVVSDAEKSTLVASSGYRVGSIHERDALAACLLAYKEYSKKFEQAERILEALEIKIPSHKVKAEIIRGSTIASSIESAIEEMILEMEESFSREIGVIQRFVRGVIEGESKIRNLEARISALLSERQTMIDRIRELEEELKRITNEYEEFKRGIKLEIERDRLASTLMERLKICQESYRSLEEGFEELKKDLEELKKIILKYEEKGYRKVPRIYQPIDSPDIDIIEKFGAMDDTYIIYIDDFSNMKRQDLEYLRERLKRVITLTPKCPVKYIGDRSSHVVCVEIPQERIITVSSRYILIDKEAIKNISDLYRSIYETIPRSLIITEEDLEKLVDEYRSSKTRAQIKE